MTVHVCYLTLESNIKNGFHDIQSGLYCFQVGLHSMFQERKCAMRTHDQYEEPTAELQALPGRTTYD